MGHLNALPAGTRLGEYEIETVLGEGGFGLFGIEIPTLGGWLGTDGPLTVQHQADRGCPDRAAGYQDAD